MSGFHQTPRLHAAGSASLGAAANGAREYLPAWGQGICLMFWIGRCEDRGSNFRILKCIMYPRRHGLKDILES